MSAAVPTTPGADTTFVRVPSHRGRERLLRALGYTPDCYYDARLRGGYAYLIWAADLTRARDAGATRCREQRADSWGKCWW